MKFPLLPEESTPGQPLNWIRMTTYTAFAWIDGKSVAVAIAPLCLPGQEPKWTVVVTVGNGTESAATRNLGDFDDLELANKACQKLLENLAKVATNKPKEPLWAFPWPKAAVK